VSSNRQIRLLIVDDHFIVRIGLSSSLKMDPHLKVVAEASTGAQAIEAYRRHLPDVVLMDLRLPDFSGIEATAMLCREFAGAKVIVISSYDAAEHISRAFQAGARGYLLKDVLDQELFRAIKAVEAGENYIPGELNRCLTDNKPASGLTPQELQVLQLLIQGVSTMDIAEIMGVGKESAQRRIKNTLTKLGVKDRAQAAAAAFERGILRWQAVSDTTYPNG
jgi:two-component system, NarL family, response regulator